MCPDGGYDEGYKACPCFWGSGPGSLVNRLTRHLDEFSGLAVLDAGCGEGKNAIFLARSGARVDAYDISEYGIANAKRAWHDHRLVHWNVADVARAHFPIGHYDIVIAYGLYHCLENESQIATTVKTLQEAARPGGFHLLCAFNDRSQELDAHPSFCPTLLSHAKYVAQYDKWKLVYVSDEDLTERHPHNNVPHTHSLTRIIAQKRCENELLPI